MRFKLTSVLITLIFLSGCDSGESFDWVFQEECKITPIETRVDENENVEIDLRNDARGPIRQIEVNKPESDQEFLFVRASGLFGLLSVEEEQMPNRMDEKEVVTVEDELSDRQGVSDPPTTFDEMTYADERQRFSCEVGT